MRELTRTLAATHTHTHTNVATQWDLLASPGTKAASLARTDGTNAGTNAVSLARTDAVTDAMHAVADAMHGGRACSVYEVSKSFAPARVANSSRQLASRFALRLLAFLCQCICVATFLLASLSLLLVSLLSFAPSLLSRNRSKRSWQSSLARSRARCLSLVAGSRRLRAILEQIENAGELL